MFLWELLHTDYTYLLSISKKEKEQKKIREKNCVVPVLIIEVKLDRKAVVWAKFYGVMTI